MYHQNYFLIMKFLSNKHHFVQFFLILILLTFYFLILLWLNNFSITLSHTLCLLNICELYLQIIMDAFLSKAINGMVQCVVQYPLYFKVILVNLLSYAILKWIFIKYFKLSLNHLIFMTIQIFIFQLLTNF